MAKPKLYHYWRSSSSWRVRWAFALKGIDYEPVSMNPLTDEPFESEHRARNPMGYVPALEIQAAKPEMSHLAESMALIEWADETHPSPALLPQDPLLRARARQLAEIINAGTQPLQNPNVAEFHSPEAEERKRWNQHWIRQGLQAYETLVRETAGRFSIGDAITLPDLFLIPQCYNAARDEVMLEAYPTIARIQDEALKTQACQASHPDRFKPA